MGNRPTRRTRSHDSHRPSEEIVNQMYGGGLVTEATSYPGLIPQLGGHQAQMHVAPQEVRTQTMRNEFYLKKHKAKLVYHPESGRHLLEFEFDAVLDCSITVYYSCREICNEENISVGFDTTQGRECTAIHFAAGMSQVFSQLVTPEEGILLPSEFAISHIYYDLEDKSHYPIVVAIRPEESLAQSSNAQALITYFAISRPTPGAQNFGIKLIKQKSEVQGKGYEIHDIYGINKKQSENDGTTECVICLTEPKEVTVSPCNHMCLCSGCAQVIQMQNGRCPICRSNVERFLKVKIEDE